MSVGCCSSPSNPAGSTILQWGATAASATMLVLNGVVAGFVQPNGSYSATAMRALAIANCILVVAGGACSFINHCRLTRAISAVDKSAHELQEVATEEVRTTAAVTAATKDTKETIAKIEALHARILASGESEKKDTLEMLTAIGERLDQAKTLEKDLSTLQNQLTTLEQQLQGISQENAQQKELLAEFKAASQKEIRSEADLTQIVASTTNLVKEEERAATHIDTTGKEVKALTTKLEERLQQLRQVEATLANEKEQHDALKKEAEALSTQYEDLKTQYDNFVPQIQAIDATIFQEKQAVQELITALNSLKGEGNAPLETIFTLPAYQTLKAWITATIETPI